MHIILCSSNNINRHSHSLSRHSSGEIEETHKSLSLGTEYPGRDSIKWLQNERLETLPPHQTARCLQFKEASYGWMWEETPVISEFQGGPTWGHWLEETKTILKKLQNNKNFGSQFKPHFFFRNTNPMHCHSDLGTSRLEFLSGHQLCWLRFIVFLLSSFRQVPEPIPSKSFPIHPLSHHLTLCGLDTDTVIKCTTRSHSDKTT
jgi:hypothetical protein